MRLLLPVFFLIFVMSSCIETGTDSGRRERAADSALPAVEAASARREAVLVRGNYWTPGIPGFGANGFPALSGDYRLVFPREEAAGNDQSGGEAGFSVFLTSETLFFSEEWQARPGIGNLRAYQRSGEEGLLLALFLETGTEAAGAETVTVPENMPWTVVILFPNGIPAPSETAVNQLFRIWSSRLSYFISLAKVTSEISLPAAVEF